MVPASSRYAASTLPPTERLIRRLLVAGLYDDAPDELRYAQRAWGTSAPVDATIAWVYHRQGELRRAITLMRRTYPQHLTSSGQALPAAILQRSFRDVLDRSEAVRPARP